MVDFNEEQVKAMLNRSPLGTKLCRWISCGNYCFGIKMNWIAFFMATFITWGFALLGGFDGENAVVYFSEGKSWVSANFTWFYIGTQDVWCAFLIYLTFSRFGSLKLGRADEKPRYNDFTWFAMLFTCGVAVGLYVYGVAEPLYFYRQPTVWHSWNYDYHHTKTSVETDAQRAMQAIFMAVYHWGIHGWVPYILLALTLGVVSFRWGLPPTIRSCFYPLLGDHSLGLFGDIIDSLSVATTTFGVCTSLGLGVTQLATGLQSLRNINCVQKDNCVAAGGVWRLDTMGTNNCYESASSLVAVSYDECKAEWLASDETKANAYYVIICSITFIATISVLTGIDRGIKTLAAAAFTCGMIVMVTCLFSDNTWYLLNIMVQSTGYYIQHVIQVGFDCEAFQQLSFELSDGGNFYWGSTGANSIKGVFAAANLDVATSSADCGDQVNPCTSGFIRSSMLSASGLLLLQARSLSARSTSTAAANYAGYGGFAGVPCGSGWNTTHADAGTSAWTGIDVGMELCPDVETRAACQTLWTDPPRCPETTFVGTGTWGQCADYMNACPIGATYYDDSNAEFMNWWTIFYWAWWITWAPFVGFFVALISRGRTVREVIIGGFFCPTLFAIIWFSVFGGLAIKMERTAEMGLGVRPDWKHGQVTCAEHYSGGVPITPEAKRLADEGYYLLSCLARDDQMYRLMEPYENRTQFLHFWLWVGLVIYFLTSSDSGSMTDDIITASGLSADLIPAWQKVFWCCTEGAVAVGLIRAGGALKSLQHVSIIIGLPYTFFLCMLVPSLYRALKREAGDTDIRAAKRFNTQLLDILELFHPRGGSPCAAGTHVVGIVLGLLVPAVPIFKVMKANAGPGGGACGAALLALTAQLLLIAWIVLEIAEYAPFKGGHVLGWVCWVGFAFIVSFVRNTARKLYNVWGSYADDVFATMFLWPFVLAQAMMAADTDNKDAPTYFASADEVEMEMRKLGEPTDSAATLKKNDDKEVADPSAVTTTETAAA